MIPYSLIENYSDLSRVALEISKEAVIGVDLEGDSLFHYQEKVCLIQISTNHKNIIIDPLSLQDLSILAPIFANPNIRKIFHGSDYDIRSLYRDFNIKVKSLFDTQLASRFLGLSQTSLATLLNDKFDILIEKKYQRRDWSKRPLPEEMLKYAVKDTFYLLDLGRILEKELEEKGRLPWVEEECEILSRVRPAPSNNGPLFMKFKGAGKLEPRNLATLEAILQLREEVARLKDRPPFKVIGNKQILDIVYKRPVSEKGLHGLSQGQIKGLGPSILQRIQEVINLSEDKLPVFPKAGRISLSPPVTKRIKSLKKWTKEYADMLGIDRSLILTNSQIQSLALACPVTRTQMKDIDGIRNWQRKLFGSEVCSILKSL
jgi:ribonuclease D